MKIPKSPDSTRTDFSPIRKSPLSRKKRGASTQGKRLPKQRSHLSLRKILQRSTFSAGARLTPEQGPSSRQEGPSNRDYNPDTSYTDTENEDMQNSVHPSYIKIYKYEHWTDANSKVESCYKDRLFVYHMSKQDGCFYVMVAENKKVVDIASTMISDMFCNYFLKVE